MNQLPIIALAIIIVLMVATIIMPIVVIMIDGRVARIRKELTKTNHLLQQLIIAQHSQPQPMQRAKPITKRYELPAA